MKKATFSLAAFLLFLLPATLPAFSPMDLMPKDNEVAGWIGDTNSGCVEGAANDTDDLYLYIDGPAYDYIIVGWIKGAFKGYIDSANLSPDDTIETCIEIYDQATHQNAIKLFADIGDTGVPYEILPTLGDTARMNTILFNIFLEMVSKSYFVRLTIGSTDSTYKQDLIDLASSINQKILTPIIYNSSKLQGRNHSFSLLPNKNSITFRVRREGLLKNNPGISEILLYNTRGTLIDRVALKRGKNNSEVVGCWDGNNLQGIKVSAGSYFAVMYLEDGIFSRKFILP